MLAQMEVEAEEVRPRVVGGTGQPTQARRGSRIRSGIIASKIVYLFKRGRTQI